MSSFTNLAEFRAKLEEKARKEVRNLGKEDDIKNVQILDITFKLIGEGDKQFPLNTEADFQLMKTEYNNGRFAGVDYHTAVFAEHTLAGFEAANSMANAVEEANRREKLSFK